MAQKKTRQKSKKSEGVQGVIFPGSFDPVTKGHVDVIERLRRIFERVIVVVADSPRKKYAYSKDERVKLMRTALSELSDVEVVSSSELTIDIAKKYGVRIIARSVRTVGDWEYEYAMAFANKKLAPDIETFFIMADPELGFISSSLVREVAQYGGDLKEFVPASVIRSLKKK